MKSLAKYKVTKFLISILQKQQHCFTKLCEQSHYSALKQHRRPHTANQPRKFIDQHKSVVKAHRTSSSSLPIFSLIFPSSKTPELLPVITHVFPLLKHSEKWFATLSAWTCNFSTGRGLGGKAFSVKNCHELIKFFHECTRACTCNLHYNQTSFQAKIIKVSTKKKEAYHVSCKKF